MILFRYHNPLIVLLLLTFISITPLLETNAKTIIVFALCIYMLCIIKHIPRHYIVILSFISFIILGLDFYHFINNSVETFSLFPYLLVGNITLAVLVSISHRDYKEVFIRYETFIFKIALVSFLFFLLLEIFPYISNFSFSYSYGGFESRSFFFLNFYEAYGVIIHRNVGMASEPALWQFVIIFCLIIYLDNVAKVNMLKLSLYVLMIISTFSGLAFVVLILILMYYFKSNILFYFISILMLCCIAYFISLEVLFEFNSLNKFTSNYLSERYEPSIVAFEKFTDNIFGLGSSYYDVYNHIEGFGAFDSYMQAAIRYGILGLLFLLVTLSLVFYYHKNGFILLFLTLLTQSVWTISLSYIMIFYFIKGKKKYES